MNMRTSTRRYILGGILFLVAALGVYEALSLIPDKVITTRTPYPGCTWKMFESAELGIRMPVQECSKPSDHYVFSVEDNKVVHVLPVDKEPTVAVEVFTKPADQPIREAIKERFIDTLPGGFNKTCVVDSPSGTTSQKERFVIKPNEARMKIIEKEAGTDMPDYSECGDHAINYAITYFEYQPERSKTTYFYVYGGQDQQPFDEGSIEILAK